MLLLTASGTISVPMTMNKVHRRNGMPPWILKGLPLGYAIHHQFRLIS